MNREMLNSVGLLLLRVGFGSAMLFGHGLDKLRDFSDMAGKFPDPIGLGSTTSLVLAVLAEFGCSALLILGLGTRLAAIPLAFTMLVAVFVFHADDLWEVKELAAVYLVVFTTLILTGGGRFSCDAAIHRKLKAKSGRAA